MKKIKVYIVVSLDGMSELAGISPNRHEYRIYDSIDTVITGNGTFQEFMNTDVEWPYGDKFTYVLSSHKNSLPLKENIAFLTENIPGTGRQLKEQAGKDIWLAGGGQTITFLLNCDLTGELQLCCFPVIPGKGVPLFSGKLKKSNWKLSENTVLHSGILKATYQRNL
jgi:dihydrofolate reductase